jgi:hypothetical protein
MCTARLCASCSRTRHAASSCSCLSLSEWWLHCLCLAAVCPAAVFPAVLLERTHADYRNAADMYNMLACSATRDKRVKNPRAMPDDGSQSKLLPAFPASTTHSVSVCTLPITVLSCRWCHLT